MEPLRTRRGEGGDPDDRLSVAEKAVRSDERGTYVPESRPKHIRAMTGRLEPRENDVAGAGRPQRADVDVLTEARVPVARRAKGRRQI